jgi:hypothetical protein
MVPITVVGVLRSFVQRIVVMFSFFHIEVLCTKDCVQFFIII